MAVAARRAGPTPRPTGRIGRVRWAVARRDRPTPRLADTRANPSRGAPESLTEPEPPVTVRALSASPAADAPASSAHRTPVRRGLNRLALLDRPTGRSSAATNAAGPASWSTWKSRSSVASPAAEGGGSTTVPPAPTAAAPPATTTSTYIHASGQGTWRSDPPSSRLRPLRSSGAAANVLTWAIAMSSATRIGCTSRAVWDRRYPPCSAAMRPVASA